MQYQHAAVDEAGVTPPRHVEAGKLHFVTCGAVGRSFRFLPTTKVVELIWFVFAVMVAEFGIEVHEVVFMSNHFHVLLTDRRGNLPNFMRDFNSLLSRGLNALRGSTGTNIEKGYNAVEPADEERVVTHAVYTLVNPCAAHLVKRVRDWKGVSSYSWEYGEEVRFERPTSGLWKSVALALVELRKLSRGKRVNRSKRRLRWAGRTKMPKSVGLALVRPKVMTELSDSELRQHIRAEVNRHESELSTERRKTGLTVLGMRRVRQQQYTDTPKTSRVLFNTTPRISGQDRWARLDALSRRLDFEAAHAKARNEIAGLLADERGSRQLAVQLRKVVIPRGAWLLRKQFGSSCTCAA